LEEQSAAVSQSPKAGDTVRTIEQDAAKREAGLHKWLSSREVAMIGLGCTIGTGLFLGSAISVNLAGPAVILSFAAGAIIAGTVMWSIPQPARSVCTPKCICIPGPDSRFAIPTGSCPVMVVGSEVVAAAIYCKFWLPHAPAWIWIAGFSVILVLINTFSIEDFGAVEYWFAMIKVVTIVAFLILGAMLLFGVGFPRIGLNNFTA
jgi:amino acid transporter, AAT family